MPLISERTLQSYCFFVFNFAGSGLAAICISGVLELLACPECWEACGWNKDPHLSMFGFDCCSLAPLKWHCLISNQGLCV